VGTRAVVTDKAASPSATRGGTAGVPGLPSGLPAGLLSRDETSGQPYLKLPLPEPETVQKILELFGALTQRK
jgi:hypothetical protein